MRNALGLFFTIATALCLGQSGDPKEFFENRIRPVLATNCFACHTASKLGGLRLDSRDSILAGGGRGPAIVPGKPDESLLIRAVSQVDPKLKMPMSGKLKESEIADLSAWIRMGAPWPASMMSAKPSGSKGFVVTPEQKSFWSFQPLSKPGIPRVKDSSWAASPIDAFILAKLEGQGLTPARLADKPTLIRRATFDLTGLPPTVEELKAFLADDSAGAYARLIDRLLASPRYGERWGRHWLDVARYTDEEVRVRKEYTESWRYRDWVIAAFNEDMPYSQFVKAQIAGDLFSKDDPQLLPALGFISLGTWVYQGDIPYADSRANELDDRIDVLTRGFLGLTVACARCHDHKYDPISQKDYYALGGVFASTDYRQHYLASKEDVAAYKAAQQKIRDKNAEIQKFLAGEGNLLEEQMAGQLPAYMMAARKILVDSNMNVAKVASEERLDRESLERWVRYLAETEREHSYLQAWDAVARSTGRPVEARAAADEFQKRTLEVMAEKKRLEEENKPARGRARGREGVARTFKPDGNFYYDNCLSCETSIKVLERDKFYLLGDLFQRTSNLTGSVKRPAGPFEFNGTDLVRFLSAGKKAQYDRLQQELKDLEKASPPETPYIMAMTDAASPLNLKINVRGNVNNLGDETPRGFPAVLAGSGGDPLPFANGSGRLELAEAIVRHPLTARVMANRIWAQHFGRGIVATPSNFGQTGERPSHPELLEYLASRLVENNWSIKSLHREIMLSTTYRLSSESLEPAATVDEDNRFFSHANIRRLDAEELRDSMLYVGGGLDLQPGGRPRRLTADNKRRTVYAKVSRATLDPLLRLFDFPDPGITSEQRIATNVPLQGLFFLNSEVVQRQAELLAEKLGSVADDNRDRIGYAYQLLFARDATEAEIDAGLEFLGKPGPESKVSRWQKYAQVLFSSGEFYFVR